MIQPKTKIFVKNYLCLEKGQDIESCPKAIINISLSHLPVCTIPQMFGVICPNYKNTL